MEELRKTLKEKRGLEIIAIAATTDYKFHNKNKTVILAEFIECGHEKKCKISSLYSEKNSCNICKRHTKYGYNSLTKEKTCSDCLYVHKNVPETNLGRYSCWFCKDSNKPEIKLLKMLKIIFTPP